MWRSRWQRVRASVGEGKEPGAVEDSKNADIHLDTSLRTEHFAAFRPGHLVISSEAEPPGLIQTSTLKLYPQNTTRDSRPSQPLVIYTARPSGARTSTGKMAMHASKATVTTNGKICVSITAYPSVVCVLSCRVLHDCLVVYKGRSSPQSANPRFPSFIYLPLPRVDLSTSPCSLSFDFTPLPSCRPQ